MREVQATGCFTLRHAVRRTGRAPGIPLRGEVGGKNGRHGRADPCTLCFVACLVTSKNRLELKSPVLRPRDILQPTALTSVVDDWISVAVSSGCEPMERFSQ